MQIDQNKPDAQNCVDSGLMNSHTHSQKWVELMKIKCDGNHLFHHMTYVPSLVRFLQNLLRFTQTCIWFLDKLSLILIHMYIYTYIHMYTFMTQNLILLN